MRPWRRFSWEEEGRRKGRSARRGGPRGCGAPLCWFWKHQGMIRVGTITFETDIVNDGLLWMESLLRKKLRHEVDTVKAGSLAARKLAKENPAHVT